MRVIKFRAWHLNLNEFLKDGFSISQDGLFLYDDNLNEWEIDPNFVIEQYTGLKDKNGVEIYEGDVIRGNLYEWDLPTMGCIIYDSEHSTFANKNDGGITFLFRINKISVIGNIRENPELIEND